MTILFVPQDFIVPTSLVTDQYILEMLTPLVAEIDYNAVMSSKSRLRSVFEQNDDWPQDDMTLEFNIKDLVQHKKEFRARQAFAFTVLNPAREKCLGCIYIDPPTVSEFDCEVYLWVRDSHIHLDDDLFQNVKQWLQEEWPFKSIAFPGREISWDAWNA
jgi:hypothetical protein